MADRIVVSTETLEAWAQKIEALQEPLSIAAGILTSVNTTGDSGGELSITVDSKLNNGAHISGNDVAGIVRSIITAMAKTSEDAAQISMALIEAASLFEKSEQDCIRALEHLAEQNDDEDSENYLPNLLEFLKGLFGKNKAEREQNAAEEEKRRALLKSNYEERKREYLDILKTMRSNENPMNNQRLVELIRDELFSCGFSEQECSLIIEKLKSVPAEFADYRDIYIYSLFDYSRINASDGRYNGVYHPSSNTLYANSASTTSDDDFIQTFFHESGHAIDANANDCTLHNGLYDCIETDTKAYIMGKINVYGDNLTNAQKETILNAFLSGNAEEATVWLGRAKGNPPDYLSAEEKRVYKKVVELSYYNLKKTPLKSDCAPWDIITGMTNNAITSGGGHLKSYVGEYYWFNSNGSHTGLECKEAWAEYYSSILSGDNASYACNREYLPESTRKMDEIARQTADYYRNKVRNG